MELTESQIYEGFGLEQPSQQVEQSQEQPAEAGNQGQEEVPAESQDQQQEQPAQEDVSQEQLRQDPETDQTQQQEQTNQTQQQEQTNQTQEHRMGEMSLEQRRENAARRRREETQAAINQALNQERERNDQAMKEFFAGAGLKNTLTGAPITSMEEYRNWKKEFDQAKLQQELQSGKLTPEGLAQAIAQNPTIKQAEILVNKARMQAETAEREAMQAKIDAEIGQIHQMDPSVNSVEDLLAMPNADHFRQLVKRGNSFLDAYKLANYDQLTQRAAAAARQQAQNLARSKNHLTAGSQQGAGAATVPTRDLEMFRMFNPQASDSAIQEYYNKYRGGK